MAKGKSATRRGERELAFQVLYGLSFTPARDIDDLRRIFRISPDYLARNDVPPKVAINEALELSRQFGEGNAKSFINGILDAVAKALETGGISRPAADPSTISE